MRCGIASPRAPGEACLVATPARDGSGYAPSVREPIGHGRDERRVALQLAGMGRILLLVTAISVASRTR